MLLVRQYKLQAPTQVIWLLLLNNSLSVLSEEGANLKSSKTFCLAFFKFFALLFTKHTKLTGLP